MSTELVVSDAQGNLKIHDSRGNIHVLFMSGGMCSAYALRDLCLNYQNEPNQVIYIVACNATEEQLESITEIVRIYEQHYVNFKFNPVIIHEDFNNISEWLPKFIHDIFDEYLLHKIRIVICSSSDRLNKITTSDDEINNMIEYPMEKYDHYRIFKRTIDFSSHHFNYINICEANSYGKYCGECNKCIEFKHYLTACAMTYPKEEIQNLAKLIYLDAFGEPMNTEGMVIADDNGNIQVLNTGIVPEETNIKIKYISRDRSKEV